MNPIGPNGQRLKCHRCNGENHFIKDCPQPDPGQAHWATTNGAEAGGPGSGVWVTQSRVAHEQPRQFGLITTNEDVQDTVNQVYSIVNQASSAEHYLEHGVVLDNVDDEQP